MALRDKIEDYVAETGSTWMPVNKVIAEEGVVYRKKEGQLFIADEMIDDMENFIAINLFRRACVQTPHYSNSQIDELISRVEQRESEKLGFEFQLAPEQREGIRMFVNNNIAILSGGPGTGKTSVVKSAVQCLKWVFPQLVIEFTAPTGKAARRLEESSGYPAQTIQKLIGDSPLSDELNQIWADILFIDEVSMLDLPTMANILQSVSPSTRIYLIGDVEQLPSVGFGAVLRDIIDSKTIPFCQLEKTFRQDNSTKLFSNIQIVKLGGYVPLIEGSDFKRINTEDNVLNTVVKQYMKGLETYGLDETVILTPNRKEGTVCSEKLNVILQSKLNPLYKGKPFMEAVIERDGRERKVFYMKNDPVMQIVNGDKVANGDIGKVIYATPDYIDVQFIDCILRYTHDNIDELELAYALSIHKSQGSEYKCVVTLFMEENKDILSRNLVYTAITRAKKECIVIGRDDVISDACKVQSAWKRYTFLADDLMYLQQKMLLKAGLRNWMSEKEKESLNPNK